MLGLVRDRKRALILSHVKADLENCARWNPLLVFHGVGIVSRAETQNQSDPRTIALDGGNR